MRDASSLLEGYEVIDGEVIDGEDGPSVEDPAEDPSDDPADAPADDPSERSSDGPST